MRRAWLLLLVACDTETPPALPPPAKVQNAVSEGSLTTVVLTDQAVGRVGIKTAPVERRKIDRFRQLGGEAIVPPGRSATVAAPLAGTPAGDLPAPGTRVKAGQTLTVLAPLLTSEARATLSAAHVEAEGDLAGAAVRWEAAKIAVTRAEKLLADGAGSQRGVDEARAQRDAAESAQKAAGSRRDLLAGAIAGTIASVPILSPLDGVVRAIHAVKGQTVASGAPLLDVAALDPLWIRVAVYVGEASRIDREREARVGPPGALEAPGLIAARPVQAPPSAGAETVDLFYEIAGAALAPGQRVGVRLPLKEEAQSLVIPWSAVVHDVHGGAWIYERIDPRTFTRRRVQVRAVEGTLALLENGPAPGTEIVTEGAAELFGTEFFEKK